MDIRMDISRGENGSWKDRTITVVASQMKTRLSSLPRQEQGPRILTIQPAPETPRESALKHRFQDVPLPVLGFILLHLGL